MNTESIRNLKHDILSDINSIMATIEIIKDDESISKETSEILSEIFSRKLTLENKCIE